MTTSPESGEVSRLRREVDLSWIPKARSVALRFLWPITPLISLLVLFPWPFRDPDTRLDYSWSLVLQQLHGGDLVFGRDLMLNYGAWGFTFFGYLPSTRGLVILCWVLLSQLLVLGLIGATRAHSRRFVGLTCAWLALLVLSIQLPDVRVLSFAPILFALGAFDPDRKHLLLGEIGIGIALGWVVTIKFSSFVIAIPVLIAHTWDQWFLRRRVSPVIPLFTAAFLLAQVTAGQPVSALGDWAWTSLQNVIGYGTCGVASDKFHQAHPMALFIAGAAALGFAMAIYLFRKRRWRSIPALITLALIFGVLLKAGYMRHDMGHQINAPLVFLVLVLVLTPGMVVHGKRPDKTLFLVAFVIAVYSANLVMQIDRRRNLNTVFAEEVARIARGVRNISANETSLREFHEKKMERIRKTYPLPAGVVEPVDLYSYMQSIVFAHGLKYTPRPAFQSYFAWTPYLASANARFLEGPRAPASILFALETIDERYPTFDDSLSYVNLLSLYEPVSTTEDLLLLRRRNHPVAVELKPLAVLHGRVGERIEIPASDHPIWATIQTELSGVGRLTRLMLRPPEVRLLADVSGSIEDYRFIPDYGRMGFLISPVLRDHFDFATLYEPQPLEERVLRSLRLTTGSEEGDRLMLEPEITIELQQLVIEETHEAPDQLPSDASPSNDRS